MNKKVLNPKNASHYLILTGLRFVESGSEGRRLHVVACVSPAEGIGLPEVAGSFLAPDSELPEPGSVSTRKNPTRGYCRRCASVHRYYTLMEALEERLLPTGEDGSSAAAVELPDLVSVTLGWQRAPALLKRRAS